MSKGEVVIVGSGLGGLACGCILAREGYSVTVLEKNQQIGGMLQTFSRDKTIFDTGIHYVGSLGAGENLNQLFRFMGIMDKLKLRKMDDDVFDGVMVGDDPTIYRYAQGYDNFRRTLVSYFPDEAPAINHYCDEIIRICGQYPMYNLEHGAYSEDRGNMTDTQSFLRSLTTNVKLIAVLGGTSLLYAGEPGKTPLYIHALIVNHYIRSSWKFVDGGSQIARLLGREITSRGGKIVRHALVTELREEAGNIVEAITEDGNKFTGDLFISNAHPVKTMEMTPSPLIRNAYRSRLESIENTTSVFYANVVMKDGMMPYRNHNLYVLEREDPWCAIDYTEDNWPQGYAIFFNATSGYEAYTDGVTIMTYMRFDEVRQWADSFNTVDHEAGRGESYQLFKKRKAEKLFDAVEKRMPGFRACIQSYTTATPLTARDYIGSDDGSLYGYAKDYRDPLKSTLSTRTRIPNLFLTGQNINLHGVLGVTLSAVVTCGQVLGTAYLIDRIRNA